MRFRVAVPLRDDVLVQVVGDRPAPAVLPRLIPTLKPSGPNASSRAQTAAGERHELQQLDVVEIAE
jgi:hypothetical protein